MGNFLDKYHLSKLNQDQISKLNRSITTEETEKVIKSLSAKKPAQNQIVSAQNSIRFSRMNEYQYSSNCSTEQKQKEHCQTLYEATITLIPKPQIDITKKELQTNLTHEH